jgi:hypothetical protein
MMTSSNNVQRQGSGGSMLQHILKRAALAVLGVLVMIAWWEITGDRGTNDEVKGIPPKVWDGGSGTLEVEVETTTPARFSISFGDEKEVR